MGGRVDEVCTNREYAEHVKRMTQNIPMLVTGKLDGTDFYLPRRMLSSKKRKECVSG